MTITNPLPPTKKLAPFRRFAEQGINVRVLHQSGKAAIGMSVPQGLRTAVVYIGRWRNIYARSFTIAGVFAKLKEARKAHRAHEQALISYSDALAQLLVPAGQLKLFLLTFGLKSDQNYSRQSLRRLILSRRGKFTACQLRCLNQIVIDSHTLY